MRFVDVCLKKLLIQSLFVYALVLGWTSESVQESCLRSEVNIPISLQRRVVAVVSFLTLYASQRDAIS